MNRRFVCSAISVAVVTCAVVTVGTASAQLRDGALLPPGQSGHITAVGCLVRSDQVRGGDDDKYVLARPRVGPVENVPEATCTAAIDANALTLDHAKKFGINDSMIGKWVEISGVLEKETSKNPDNLRELDVESFRVVPVAPRLALAAPAPRPPARPAVEPPVAFAPEPEPVAPAPDAPALPKTASPLPVVGLLGLLSLAGGVILRTVRSRE